jgi:hypothetical protein
MKTLKQGLFLVDFTPLALAMGNSLELCPDASCINPNQRVLKHVPVQLRAV